MRNRPSRGILGFIADAINRILTGGPEPEAGPPLRPVEEKYEQKQFEPLPTTSTPREEQEEVIYEETVIVPAPVLNNVEYVPGHYGVNRSGGTTRVYGHWHVYDPQPGDIEDLMYTQDSDEITMLIIGQTQRYAGLPLGKDAASYRFSVSELQYIMDQNRGDRTFTTEELINQYLAQSGDEWSVVRDAVIINKQDRPE